MIRNRFLLKTIAVFLAVEIFASALAPSFSWALTAGPTAPEATSFEPVDTSDLVNHVTGDLAYNIPLLEVPGPAGGFPIGLSYHAGIMPNEDASWVGLGFTLNPGAINRNVSGYPDDHFSVTGASRDFWEGGESKSYSLGVNVASSGGTSVSAGLTYSDDTYRGSGVGYNYGVSATSPIGGGMSTNVSYQGGVSPYGESYSSTGIGIGIGYGNRNFSTTANAGVSIDQNNNVTTRLSAKMALGSVDASISTSNPSVSVSAGGNQTSVYNSRAGNISTRGYNFSQDIPIYGGISIRLGKSYERYWSDETALITTYGSMHFPSYIPTDATFDRSAFDVYDLQDVNKPLSKSIPDESQVGSFIDYDNYQVLGQGIGGNIRPYHYKSYIFRQHKKVGDTYRVKNYPLAVNKKPTFRFIGDFSNRYIDKNDDVFNVNSSNSTTPLSFSYQHPSITGESGNDGFDSENNILPGSKHIEFFTNASMLDKNRIDENGNSIPVPDDAAIKRGFLDTKSPGFNRVDDTQIGGFKVTNESGVTYHYSLPVLSWDEQTYSGTVDDKGKHKYNTYKRDKHYAYSWLLTAMTGPDYVDRNENGYADEGDWGYWVSFEYGMWSGRYSWRNPSEGFNKDIDQNFSVFSKGKKQLYYLNSIKTATHTALFVKEIRIDGKGVVDEIDGLVKTGTAHNVEDLDDGGFTAKAKKYLGSNYVEYPVSTLKLNAIYLLKNSDLADITNAHSLSDGYSYPETLANFGKYILGKNVLDVYDAQVEPLKSVLHGKAQKTIVFETDYSLCPSTANSFKSDLDTSVPDNVTSNGKLTLKSIKILGKNGVSLLPDTKFSYDLDERFSGRFTNGGSQISIGTTDDFKPGDIVKYVYNNSEYFDYIVSINSSTSSVVVRHLNYTAIPYAGYSGTFEKTKNPPYSKDHYDLWGMYKVDYQDFGSENVSRRVTSVSANAVDVWSLRQITSSLGAKTKLEYESDTYTSALKSLSNIPIKSIEALSYGRTKIVLYEDIAEYGLQEGDLINMRLVSALKYDVKDPSTYSELRFDCNGDKPYVWKWIEDNNYGGGQPKIPIHTVDRNSFIIDYSFRDRFPTAGGLCIDKAYPYAVRDKSSSTATTCIDMGRLEFSEFRFLGGEILSDKAFSPYGGGIRVKKVSLEADNLIRSTLFNYDNGVTTYEPLGFALPLTKVAASEIYQCLETLQQEAFDSYRDKYVADVYNRFQFLFANSRELPGPGVMYEQVTVRERVERPDAIVDILGKSVYQFEVFSPNSIVFNNASHGALVTEFKNQFGQGNVTQLISNYSGTPLGLNVKLIETRNYARIKDYSSIMGNLKRIILYDKDDNKITETENHYLHDNFTEATFLSTLDKLKNQGVVTETFADARIIINPESEGSPTSYTLFGLLSQKIKYPSIQTEATTINYKTGIKTTTRNIGFDFYSGQVTQSTYEDGYGNTYLNETTPAYRKYAQMGLAYTGGKNMLTQEAATYSYKYNPSEADIAQRKKGLVSASAQTWGDYINVLQHGQNLSQVGPQPGVWRKVGSYIYTGNDNEALQIDGLYKVSSFHPFDAWEKDDPLPDGWQRTTAVTFYDKYSHTLEISDINDHLAASKMTFDQSKVNVTAANAAYGEFAYSSVEEKPNSNDVGKDLVENSTVYAPVAHTGTKALLVNPGARAFTFYTKPKQRTYRVSVWSSQPTGAFKYKLNSGAVVPIPMVNKGNAGSWYLLEGDVTITQANAQLELWCEAGAVETYFDDFRVCPTTAVITSYVYNSFDELTHILGNDHLYTEYSYDAMGRLVSTRKETFQSGYGTNGIVKTSDVIYSYGRSNAYAVSISTSKTGTSGEISPFGDVRILQGGTQVFSIAETCSSPKLVRVQIDSKTLDLSLVEHTLWDGTKVRYTGGKLEFRNVQSSHSLRVDYFTSPGGGGGVSCHYDDDGCASGDYDYYIIDNCGDRVYREDIPFELIPVEYRPATKPTCQNIPGSECGTRD
jgi:hypothetical protein